jgi:predicted extracellular nuclease
VSICIGHHHFKSKVEDTGTLQHTLPRRQQQAHFVAGLAQEILVAQPGASLVVLGDLNDHPDSSPVIQLSNAGLANLALNVEPSQRYTAIFQGVAHTPDQALVRLLPGLVPLAVTPVHINADYPYNLASQGDSWQHCSDHDPLLVQLGLVDHLSYLPLVRR